METASIENSLPMEGRAMFKDDPMKGVRKEVITAMVKMTFLLNLSCV
jgi:hypothetical protein